MTGDLIEQLHRAGAAVGQLVAGVRPEQWSDPTPCPDWTVRRLVEHLVGMNRVFTALLADQPAPQRSEQTQEDLVGAYQESAAELLSSFAQPGVLERTYRSPMGEATGTERLQIRLYDLLAHGWDLARATGQPAVLPDEVAEQSLAFVRVQLAEDARPGRFGPAQPAAAEASAINRLVAFLGRSVDGDG